VSPGPAVLAASRAPLEVGLCVVAAPGRSRAFLERRQAVNRASRVGRGTRPRARKLAQRPASNRIASRPGLGNEVECGRSSAALSAVPAVVDADALNALAGDPPRWSECPVVLTPHPGEARPLARAAREQWTGAGETAIRRARRASSQGRRPWSPNRAAGGAQPHRNPGLATGGNRTSTGLLGLLARLRRTRLPGRRLPPGLAADWASRDLGDAG
jgi:hypothetical protein